MLDDLFRPITSGHEPSVRPAAHGHLAWSHGTGTEPPKALAWRWRSTTVLALEAKHGILEVYDFHGTLDLMEVS